MTAPAYGLLTYPLTDNLGDDIQSLAALQYLPRVDRILDRENLDAEPAAAGPVRAIFNGWFMHHPRRWPPAPCIEPLLISVHLSGSKRSRWYWPPRPTASEILLAPGRRDYFRRHGPVGARDPGTLAALRRAGIEGYHSGCLTLTLARPEVPRGAEVVACDVPPRVGQALARRYGASLRSVTHVIAEPLPYAERMARARSFVDLYARAHVVVTTRVHCALPCLAMGTPVLYLPMPSDLGRKAAATGFTHHCQEEAFLAGTHGYDLDGPPPNPEAHLELRDALARRCREFIGA